MPAIPSQIEPFQAERPASRIDDIERLRALAIAMTLVAHLVFLAPWSAPVIHLLSSYWLGSGVDLFFVISGYVITKSLAETRFRQPDGNIRRFLFRFWLRRIFRLMPAALLTISLTLALASLAGTYEPFRSGGSIAATWRGGLAAALQYFNVWGYQRVLHNQPFTMFGAFWSLSLEEQFYALFPLAFLACGTLRRLSVLAAVIIAASFMLPKSLPPQIFWWFRIDGLFWGVLIYALGQENMVRRWHWPRPARWFGIPVLLACTYGLAATITTLPWFSGANGVTLLFAAPLVAIAAQNANAFQLPARIDAFAVALGQRSYALYLVHIPIYYIVQFLWDGIVRMAGIEKTSLVLALSIATALPALMLADMLHRHVEIPWREKGKALAKAL